MHAKSTLHRCFKHLYTFYYWSYHAKPVNRLFDNYLSSRDSGAWKYFKSHMFIYVFWLRGVRTTWVTRCNFQHSVWRPMARLYLLMESRRHLRRMSRWFREIHEFAVPTPAHMSRTTCMWEGVCSQMEADWPPRAINGCHVESNRKRGRWRCNGRLSLLRRQTRLEKSPVEAFKCPAS